MHDVWILLGSFGLSLGLTLFVECGIALLFGIRGRDHLLLLLVNILTNPAVVYLNLLFVSLLPDTSVLAWQLPLEIAVVAIEGWLYARLARSVRSPWVFAAVANGFSYGLGLMLGWLL